MALGDERWLLEVGELALLIHLARELIRCCTGTACELCSAITMVIGTGSVRTGICGGRATTSCLGVGSAPAVTDAIVILILGSHSAKLQTIDSS